MLAIGVGSIRLTTGTGLSFGSLIVGTVVAMYKDNFRETVWILQIMPQDQLASKRRVIEFETVITVVGI